MNNKDIMRVYKLLLIGLFGVLNTDAMEQGNQQKYMLIGLSGSHGNGGSNINEFTEKVFGKSFITSSQIATISSSDADFGQQQCLNDFKQKAEAIFSNNSNIIMTGASQGTATLINFLAERNKEQQKKVKALILESVLANPNDAILHSARNKKWSQALTYTPFARWWLPWAVKAFMFRNYKPYGLTAIDYSLKSLNPDIPVILMHAQNDPKISRNQARQMYVAMKSNGMNPYLIEIDSHQHTNNLASPREKAYISNQTPTDSLQKNDKLTIYENKGGCGGGVLNESKELWTCYRKKQQNNSAQLIKDLSTSYRHILPLVLQRICKAWQLPRCNKLNTFDIPPSSNKDYTQLTASQEQWSDEQLDAIPLDNYQPDPEVVQKEINQSTWKQRYLNNVIDLAALSAVGAYIYHKFFKL